MSQPDSFATRLSLRKALPGFLWLVLAASLTLAATWVTTRLPRMLGDLVDRFTDGAGLEQLLPGLGIYMGFVALSAVLSKFMRMLPMRWAPLFAHRLRVQLYQRLLALDEFQIRETRIGEVMSRMTSDIMAVGNMVAMGGHSLWRATLTLVFSYVLMFQRSQEMAWVMAALLPSMIFVGYLLLRSIKERHKEVQEQLGLLTAWCQESFNGLRVIRGLGLEPLRSGRFRKMNEEFIRLNLRLSHIEIPAWPLLMSFFMVGTVLLLWVGGRLVIQDKQSLGVLVEFQQYLMLLQWPTLSISWSISMIMRGQASMRRLNELMEQEPQVLNYGDQLLPASGEAPTLQIEHLGVERDGKWLLRDIDLDLRPGELLGITGDTGSGKTLLLHALLRRFDPEEGEIRLQNIPLPELQEEALQQVARIAPQEPLLFSMSLEENLRLAAPDASEAELWQALELSAMDEEVRAMPDGLQTLIGEKGVNLSGGQRQRCAIARALLGNPKLLMLDDSLSAVDTATEARLLQAWRQVFVGRTVLLASHRYAALRHCDRVLVLQEGRVEALDTPENLLHQDGSFQELERRQRLEAQVEEHDV